MPAPRPGRDRPAAAEVPSVAELGLKPGAAQDQSVTLLAAIDAAESRGAPLLLPPGRFRVGKLDLRSGTRIVSTARATILEFIGGTAFLASEGDGIARARR
jgi:polygalacturonase